MTGSSIGQQQSPVINRRDSNLQKREESTAAGGGAAAVPKQRRGKKIGEMAGGTAAECAAVCCCCPCVLMDLMVLTVYRVPAGLWRKKKLRQQQRNSKEALLQRPSSEPMTSPPEPVGPSNVDDSDTATQSAEAADMEKEMWAHFYGTGFWRSPSQRNA